MNKINTIHTGKFAPTILTAFLAFALAFTLFACSDDGDDSGSAGGDASQVYSIPKGCNSPACLEKWNGNGDITLRITCPNGNVSINGGSVTNGKLSFDLPDASEIPERCFDNVGDAIIEEPDFPDIEKYLSVSPSDAKSTSPVTVEIISDSDNCVIEAENMKESKNGKYERISAEIGFFSNPVTITGNASSEFYPKITYSVNATAGWNTLYNYYTECEAKSDGEYCEFTATNNPESVNLKPMWIMICR